MKLREEMEALDLLGKIKLYISKLLKRKKHVSIFIFAFLTIIFLYTLVNPNIYVRYKNYAIVLYAIYALTFFTEKLKDTVYTIITFTFIVIITSFTGIDINNKIYGSIGSYFPIMMFSAFTLRFMLENYYDRKMSKNWLNFLFSTILAIICLTLTMKNIIVKSSHILITCIIYTIILSFLVLKLGRSKKSKEIDKPI